MCQIEDEDVRRLWAIHFPTHEDVVRSKTLCLTLYYIITDRAQTLIPYGAWSDKFQHALRFYGVPKNEYYEVGKDSIET